VMMRSVYFDISATTMMDSRVLEAMMPFFREQYGNPSSLHFLGDGAAIAIRDSRRTISKALNCLPTEVYFTSSGTESDNIALQGAALAYGKPGDRIITTSIEHSAILATADRLRELGFDIHILPVDREGFVDPEELERSINHRTVLVSVMAANNVVGSMQDVPYLAAICQEKGVLFHTDAVQGFTKMDLDMQKMGIDMLSISGHKFHGPKGIGALYVRNGVKLKPLFYGGGQEGNLRPATENVPGIVGMGKAVELAMEGREEDIRRMTSIRDHIIDGAMQMDGIALNGPRERRLCNNVHLRFPGISGKDVVFALSDMGLATSTASACTAESVEPSHVLTAMGIPPEEALSVLRVSLSRFSTMDEADYFLDSFSQVLKGLREGK
ncbi:MAG: cysteine desulfurase, partial [Spirochaetia bacterium]|nr:cysteine desulfurase [Spirochaetia bacterium]